MLRFMRRHATGYMIKAMFMAIIAVFILWGVGSFKEGEKTLEEVGPYKITATEYQQAYQNLLNFYRMIYREQLDEKMMAQLKLKDAAMNQLIDKYLMLVKADELGVRVSDKELTDSIASMEEFKRDGKFDKAVYMELLKRNNTDPKVFEESQKQSLLVRKMLAILQDNGVAFSERDIRDSYIKERGQVRLGYTAFDPAQYTDQVKVQDKEIEDTYEKEKGNYRTENSYHLIYMVIDNKGPVKDDQAYMDLLKSKDLAAYAKSKGLEVVDLGNMKGSDVMTRLSRLRVDTWLKGMNQGDVSLPVRDSGKSYIFQVVEKTEGKPLGKEEALKLVRAKLVAERARTLAKAKAEEAIKDKSTSFTKETGLIPRQSQEIPGLGPIPKDDTGLLALSSEKKMYEKPVDFGGRYYVFSYAGEKQPDEAQWEKEKDGFKQSYLARKRSEFLESLKNEMKKQVKIKTVEEAF